MRQVGPSRLDVPGSQAMGAEVCVRDTVLQPVCFAISEQSPRGEWGCLSKSPRCSGSKYGLNLLGRSPGEGKGYPFQSSGLENSMDCIVHGVTNSWTWLSQLHFHFLIYICTHMYIHNNTLKIYTFTIWKKLKGRNSAKMHISFLHGRRFKMQ